jgi:hypothetical protein
MVSGMVSVMGMVTVSRFATASTEGGATSQAVWMFAAVPAETLPGGHAAITTVQAQMPADPGVGTGAAHHPSTTLNLLRASLSVQGSVVLRLAIKKESSSRTCISNHELCHTPLIGLKARGTA